MKTLHLYNSKTHKKEEFKTIEPNVVNMYVCGPTVYDFLHIGNFRGAIFYNALRNFLELKGYTVNFAYNYTDVDDKIIAKAIRENVSALEISSKFITEFETDFQTLNLKSHTINPKVSDYIPQMISYVEKILANNLAYVSDGSVYIRRHKLGDIGELSGRNINDGLLNNEKNNVEIKEHASDFALWKKAGTDEISWESPWGKGRPGWHLECSVMIYEIFKGQTLDIHGGGLDLLFPHHENESCQCRAHGQDSLANYWVHNNLLNFNGVKMSKSLGNIETTRSFTGRHSAELLKFIMLTHHHRSLIDFGEEQVSLNRNQLIKIYSFLKKAKKINKGDSSAFDDLIDKVNMSLNDDFNTPLAFSFLHEGLSRFKINDKYAASFLKLVKTFENIFSLFSEEPTEFLLKMDKQDLLKLNLNEEEINEAIQLRIEMRNNKEWEKSDQLRAEWSKKGISFLDTSVGMSWEIIRKVE